VDGGNDRVMLGGSTQDGAGTLAFNSGSGSIRHVHPAGTAKDNLLFAISGTNNGFQTSIDSSNNITYKFHTGGNAEAVRFGTTESVFNENSLDRDFRVESNVNSHALFVDGSTNSIALGRGANASANADLMVPFGTYGLMLESNDSTVAHNEYIDLTLNTGGGGYQGMLIVANTVKANAGARTQSLLFVAGRGTDGVANVVSTDTGSGSFTVTFPSNGVARVTNTSGNTTSLSLQFFGGQSF
jgi:hypothetical protein